jgi:hypothetical protein
VGWMFERKGAISVAQDPEMPLGHQAGADDTCRSRANPGPHPRRRTIRRVKAALEAMA